METTYINRASTNQEAYLRANEAMDGHKCSELPEEGSPTKVSEKRLKLLGLVIRRPRHPQHRVTCANSFVPRTVPTEGWEDQDDHGRNKS